MTFQDTTNPPLPRRCSACGSRFGCGLLPIGEVFGSRSEIENRSESCCKEIVLFDLAIDEIFDMLTEAKPNNFPLLRTANTGEVFEWLTQ